MESVAKKENRDVSGLVVEHGDALFRFALLRVGNRELAEDLVQETFLAAVSKIDSYREEGSILGWLQAILKNKLIDLVRSRSYQEKPADSPDFFTEWGVWKDPFSKWAQWQETPQESLERKNFFAILNECLSKLPLKQRLLIGMKAFDGLSTQEICKELQISSSNEWVMTYRARLGLRGCLEKNWYQKK